MAISHTTPLDVAVRLSPSGPVTGVAAFSVPTGTPSSAASRVCRRIADRSYGRWVVDLDRGWPTERLDLEPLTVAHAAELAPLLDDASLHAFTGGTPLSAAALAARFARLAARRSPGGDQMWGNWVLRIRATGAAAGTVQATLPAAGPAVGPAEVAWVVVRAAQGRGYAKEAARSVVDVLQEAGWTVIAHIHPGHMASQRVARAAGLSPTTDVRDGEVRWVGLPAAAS